MASITEHLFLLLKDFIGSMGYMGIAFGMLLESACIPVPSEMILPLAGFMIAAGKINLILANVVVALGGITGSLAGMLPWNFALIFLGFQLGKRYATLVHPLFKKFEYIVVGAMFCFLYTS